MTRVLLISIPMSMLIFQQISAVVMATLSHSSFPELFDEKTGSNIVSKTHTQQFSWVIYQSYRLQVQLELVLLLNYFKKFCVVVFVAGYTKIIITVQRYGIQNICEC